MDPSVLFGRLAIALALGLLVGLQRERSDSRVAGFRTFALITLFGAVSGALTAWAGAWVIAAGLVGVATLAVIGNLHPRPALDGRDDGHGGVTTEIAMLVMFGVGALLVLGPVGPAVSIGGVTALLLHLKPQLHGFAGRLTGGEVRAIMQFAAISAVALPALPDRTIDPLGVINPRHVWLMVVLIVGIGLAGYLVSKFVGTRAGTLAGGLLGGLVSSTATTVSYARRSRGGGSAGQGAVVIALASAVVYVRVAVEIFAVHPGLLATAWAPLAAAFALAAGLAGAGWALFRPGGDAVPEPENPSELKAALAFAGVFTAVLVASALALRWFGEGSLLVVAGISGLSDMDAITLTAGQMAREERVAAETAWRAILVAAASNLVFKTAAVAALGSRALLVRAGALLLAQAVGVALLAALWPASWTGDVGIGAWLERGVERPAHAAPESTGGPDAGPAPSR